jgi:hypothetical protein
MSCGYTTTKERQMQYVIEKMTNECRVWWTGEGWSDTDTDAAWYYERKEAEDYASQIGGDITGFEI